MEHIYFPVNWVFQNFSSLQFILKSVIFYLLHRKISKLFKFTVHVNIQSKNEAIELDFKTFQVYSSSIIDYWTSYHFKISKLFKFTVHEIGKYIPSLFSLISKLFKFTVHWNERHWLKARFLFQNFSSLQFINRLNQDIHKFSNFKTFQVYSSSVFTFSKELKYFIFQNFSSLQFIINI